MTFSPAAGMIVTTYTVLVGSAALGVDFHVAPDGSDTARGTVDRPFATIGRAQEAVRAALPAEKGVTVYLHEGTYYLDAPLVFTSEDSGRKGAPVVYTGVPGEEVVLSGGVRLDLEWVPYRDGILKGRAPENLVTDQLFVAGERQRLARYPDYDPEIRIFGGYTKDAFSRERATRWNAPRGGFIHAMHRNMWGDFHYAITGKDASGEVTYEGGWQNNRRYGMHGTYRFVENILEELDAPGEWFLDRPSRTLYFYPPEGVDLSSAPVEAARLRHLVEFRGSAERPVRFVTLRGVTFRHTTRTFMENREPLLRSDWTTYRGGAVFLTGVEDCALEDCFLDRVGGNAVFVSGYGRRVSVRRCHIAEAGANGVAFVGEPRAVRNPLFEYSERQHYEDIDRTPGPKSPDYPADCLVEDCLIYRTGRVEKQTAPVQIAMARNVTVRHCSIYGVPRAGINIGDGCWGGHLIEFCDVFDTVRETGDHGSFNSWGRDRYWGLKGAPAEKLSDLALLDAVDTTILRNNRWRCDHGWDIDLDDGSSNYLITGNLLLRGGLKLREGFHRNVQGNITVNNSFHPHVWYDASEDVVTGNIFMGPYRPAGRMTRGRWGREIDHNLFTTSEEDRTKFADHGCDPNSLVGDPMFRDPANGDFRVRDGSPAVALGFENFPMDRFGVRSPDLRALARTPEIPRVKVSAATASRDEAAPAVWTWRGAVLGDLEGEEYSAYGVSRESGGVRVIRVVPGSQAAMAGLLEDDLIQRLNDRTVEDVRRLSRMSKALPAAEDVKLEIVRGQVARSITVPGPTR